MINHTNFDGALDTDVLETMIKVQGASEFPILAMILGNNMKQETISEEFSWFASKHSARRNQINNAGAAYGAGTTTLIVDNAKHFAAGDSVISEATGEHMYVTGTDSGTNVIAVARGVGAIVASAASVADDAYLLIIGNAHGEGADSPAHRTGTKVKHTNFVQTFRKAVEITGRMQRMKTKTEQERIFQRKEKFDEMLLDIEHAFLFGYKSDALVDALGNKVTTMGGLRESAVSFVDNIGGVLTEPAFEAFCDTAFTYGSRTKTLFAGPILLRAIHGFYKNQMQLTKPQTDVGLRVNQIITPHGNLNLVPHNSFRGAFAGEGIVADTAFLKIRPSNGGDIQMKPDTQASGKDATRDEFFAELGLEYGPEEFHSQIRDVTG